MTFKSHKEIKMFPSPSGKLRQAGRMPKPESSFLSRKLKLLFPSVSSLFDIFCFLKITLCFLILLNSGRSCRALSVAKTNSSFAISKQKVQEEEKTTTEGFLTIFRSHCTSNLCLLPVQSESKRTTYHWALWHSGSLFPHSTSQNILRTLLLLLPGIL